MLGEAAWEGISIGKDLVVDGHGGIFCQNGGECLTETLVVPSIAMSLPSSLIIMYMRLWCVVGAMFMTLPKLKSAS